MQYSKHILQVFVGQLSPHYEALSIEVSKQTSCLEIVACIVERLGLKESSHYELAEVIGNSRGQECKERRLGPHETPVALQMLWPQSSITDNPQDFEQHEYRFCLKEKSSSDSFWSETSQLDSQLIRDYFYKFLYQPKDKEYPDLCQLTNLNEQTLLENLRARFHRGHIYTYVGSILISVNPFKFYPIYNPKYVKLYQNHRLGELPPHIFAIADSAYHSMLKQRKNQCIVISGESGSGKTEATLFLLHHLTMLSQKGSHGSGVEQTILSSGPVLEAFGNAKTAHNNNSSRFGKFIQVSYKENGLVQGACVQKYLLEKSRICSQARNERSYHVFYYLLAGASNQERQTLNLLKPSDYRYLSQSLCYTIDGCDEQYEFVRLKQSMEMVGFTPDKQYRLFAVLSAVLLIGNIEFSPKKSTYHHDESVAVKNWELACTIATLLGVSEDTLVNAITSKKAKVQGEVLVINYRLPEALAARDALAKGLYGALFDWIVLQVNYALISLKEQSTEQNGNCIGVLDIFGFEDFGSHNRFEQFCINYANEHLQYYFNQHVFQYEQEEYQREGISWTNIAFKDNVDCLALIEGKPSGLLCILDDQCSFPGATNETFLQKINSVHKDNKFYEVPQKRESAFMIKHYAGKVKYQVDGIREKNLDLMRPELISLLKNSRFNVVRELAGADPVAVFRWAILRAFFRAVSAFQSAFVKSQKRGASDPRRLKQKVSVDNTRILAAIENTQNRLRKTRHNRSRSRSHGPRNQKNLKSVKALALRTQTLGSQGRLPGSRKSPHTVTGQFQMSLHSLMEALNQANPYFIRCIKSNAAKEPNMFDNELVQRQLRYTGMLETVRIRQAGFNVRMMYDEFIQHYRILLPHGLLSSQSDVQEFLLLVQLDRCDYEVGKTKIFMRESQKQKLDALLHQTILSRIIMIQRWYRTKYQRRHFLTFRTAVIKIQAQVRCWLAQQLADHLRMQHQAATCIQRTWRGYRVRSWYSSLRHSIVRIQARVRGKAAREEFVHMKEVMADRRARVVEESKKRVGWDEEVEEDKKKKENDKKMEENFRRPTSSPAKLTKRISGDSDSSAESFAIVLTASTERPLSLPQQTHQQEQVIPPRRKTASVQKRVPLTRAPSEPQPSTAESFEEVTLRKLPSDTSLSEKPLDPSPRRMSETVLQTKRRIGLQSRRSEDILSSYTPPSSPGGMRIDRSEIDGTRPSIKTKSFRHRHYQKVPEGEGTEERTDHHLPERSISLPAVEKEKSGSAPIKLSKIKSFISDSRSSVEKRERYRSPLVKEGGRSFSNYLSLEAKREGSVSESDDNSNESSGPHTPNSFGDDSSSFQLQHDLIHPSVHGRRRPSSPLDVRLPRRKESKESSKSLPTSEERLSGPFKDVFQEPSPSPPPPPPLLGGALFLGPSTVKGEDGKRYLARSPHNLKQSQMRKGELCSACDKPFTKFFVNPGFKCTACKKIFHSACLKNLKSVGCSFTPSAGSGALVAPAAPVGKENTSPALKKLLRTDDRHWNLTRTSQFIDRSDEVIKDVHELKDLEQFITVKIYNLDSSEDRHDHAPSESESSSVPLRERKDSQVDQLFCRSLKAFKSYLVSAYSVASQTESPNGPVVLKYKDLIKNFEQQMTSLCREPAGDEAFPVTMGVNAFRGFLDEFIRDKSKRLDDKVPKKRPRRPRRKKKAKKGEEIDLGNHKFIHIFVNIYTQCEVCSSNLWLSTKALSCQKCKVTCHQKCLLKVDPACNHHSTTKAIVVGVDRLNKGGGGSKSSVVRPVQLGNVFGIPLENLLTSGEKLPVVVERLFTYVELCGIYTEGLYRKSGASSKVRELKERIDRDPDSVTFEEVPVHVLTAVLKTYFRELPEPLLTFDAYDPLLNASALEDSNEMFQTTLDIIHRLPKPNFNLLERLIFHLAHVAQFEVYNRMSCSSLAIVFSPCILRSPRSVPVQDSLNDISKQTQVIELLISRQLNKMCELLRDIENVDKECISAGARLDSLKASKLRAQYGASSGMAMRLSADNPQVGGAITKMDPREALAMYKLEDQLSYFDERKCQLAMGMSELVRGSSEEDLLSTDLSRAGSYEDLSTTTTTGSIASMRSITSTSYSLDDVDGEIFPLRNRRSGKAGPSHEPEDDSVTSSKLHQEYAEDAVMV